MTTKMRWLPLNTGYQELDERYEVSEIGLVRNSITGHCLKPNLSDKGYYKLNLQAMGISKSIPVHRLVILAFLGPSSDKEKTHTNHKDGIKTNNWLDNLEWVTPRENTRHALKLGLLSGSNYRETWTEEQEYWFKKGYNKGYRAGRSFKQAS